MNASSVFQKLVAIGQAPTQLADVVMLASSLLMAISGICAVPKMVDIGLMDREVSTLSLSLACPLITIVSYVAPTPSVLEAVRLMKASNLNVIVFKLQAACNILSIAYGLQIANAAVLMTNMFGLACQVLFLAGERHASLESKWPSFALFLSVILNVGIFVASQYVPINLLGQSITVFNIFLYSSPLMNLGTALRTRNSSQFPTFMVGVNVLNNAKRLPLLRLNPLLRGEFFSLRHGQIEEPHGSQPDLQEPPQRYQEDPSASQDVHARHELPLRAQPGLRQARNAEADR